MSAARLHSRAANGVDGEPTLPWLMAGGTLQHPVVLDEATAARFGYGSSCVLGPTGAVGVTRLGGGGEGRGQARPEDEAAGLYGEGENTIPEMGGCFRMWSDYRMALEGHASNVQAGTLLPPILDMAKTAADTFRRRWAAGGQYPELKLARVQIAERENESDAGDGGSGGTSSPMFAAASQGDGAPAAATTTGADYTASEAGQSQEMKVEYNSVSPKKRRARASGTERTGNENGKGYIEGRQDGDGEPGSGSGSADLRQQQQQQQQEIPRGGLRQVLSRLDGLDSGTLVERALEDHLQGEGERTDAAAAAPGGPTGMNRVGSGRRGADDSNETLTGNSAGAAALGVEARALSAALNGSLTTNLRDDEAVEAAAAAAAVVATLKGATNDDNDASSESGREGGAAEGMQTPTEDKFMLPGWHYLSLSGRSLSIDVRWTNMDLVLMQDPTARQGRNTGKNVLALRSSGALTVSSSGVGESIDVQLRDASLLPCFYADEASKDGDDASSTGSRGNSGGGDGDPAQRLTLILGGGERAAGAVARTWLGRGLVPASSRPLLEPFTLQIGYGTVVAQATVEGRGTCVTDGRRRRRSSGLSGRADSEDGNEDDGGGGLVIPPPATGRGEGDGGVEVMRGSWLEQAETNEHGQSLAGDSTTGVFRVAVSELQLLGVRRKAEELATVEVKVRAAASWPGLLFLDLLCRCIVCCVGEK